MVSRKAASSGHYSFLFISMIFVMSQAPWVYFYLRMTQVSFFLKVLDSLCLTVSNELVKLTDWFLQIRYPLTLKNQTLLFLDPEKKGKHLTSRLL